MANQAISALTAVTALLYADEMEVNEAGSSKKLDLPWMIGGLHKILGADATGTDVSTAQPWFPSAGAVSVEAATSYLVFGRFHSTRAAGAVSHTTGMGFGGTATITDATIWYLCGEGDVATLADCDIIVATSVSNLQVKGASTSTTEVIKALCFGVIAINATGTLIPQFTYSAAPGGAPTIKRRTSFHLWPLGSNAGNLTKGTWA